jgi:hypothetical protein
MDEATWLPLADAARVMGLSVAATRRRAKAGTVTAERRSTPQGGVWWVCVSGDAASPDGLPDDVKRQVTSSDAHPGGGQSEYVNGFSATVQTVPVLDELVILLRERERKADALQAQLGETMAAAAMWQERAGTLADRLAVAESRILALMPPESPLVSRRASEVPAPTTDALVPLPARLRALASWLVLVAIVAVIVLLVPAWVR